MFAPWHLSGHWETIKWLSYGPNIYSSRLAAAEGYADALLLSNALPGQASIVQTTIDSMYVLDGPTFSIGFIKEGKLYFPCWKTLGLLQSTTQVLCSRAAQTLLHIPVEEGVYQLDTILKADEVFVMSSTRGIIPVDRIGSKTIPLGSIIPLLAESLETISHDDHSTTR